MAIKLRKRPSTNSGTTTNSGFFKIPAKETKKYAIRLFPYKHKPSDDEYDMPMHYLGSVVNRYDREDCEENGVVTEIGLPVRMYWTLGVDKGPAIGPLAKIETSDIRKTTKWRVNAVVDNGELVTIDNFPDMAMRSIVEDYLEGDEYDNLLGNGGRDFILSVNPKAGPSGWYTVTLRDREKCKVFEVKDEDLYDFHSLAKYKPGYNAPEEYIENKMEPKDYLGKKIEFFSDSDSLVEVATVKSVTGTTLEVDTDKEVYEIDVSDVHKVVA